jgi:hypothetical protein
VSGSEAVVRGVGVDRVWQDGVQIPPNEILEKDIKWPSGETIAGPHRHVRRRSDPGAGIAAFPVSRPPRP